MRGFRPRDAESVVGAVLLNRHDAQRQEFLEQFERPYGRDVYLTRLMHERWLRRAQAIPGPSDASTLSQSSDPATDRFNRLRQMILAGHQARAERNDAHARRMAAKHADLFTRTLGYPLNDRQIEAIVHDEDRSLVVAGAGTGKTSTIIGKAAFLINEGRAKPEQILLLAFTNKAVDEMRDRLEALGHNGVRVSTFHRLGNELIAQASAAKPTVSRLASDDRALKEAVAQIVDRLIASTSGAARDFLLLHRYPVRPIESFSSPHQRHQHTLGHDVRTLRGERVRSMEECQIADWLTSQGVRYEYEKAYPHPTASVEYKQYQPDFTLPDHGVFIEHFGIGRDGKPAPCVGDPARYVEGMEWKRALHAKHGTKLIQTYSHQASGGTLFAELAKSLSAAGVPTQPLPPEAIAELLRPEQVVKPVVELLCTFLNLYKANGWTLAEVNRRVEDARNARASCFLGLFESVLAEYQRILAEEGAIDFSDMIQWAVSLVTDGAITPDYRYILVDEFQDISRGRAQLLQAILHRSPGSKLFAVGDDWQSIYRFAGSDIDLMVRFPAHFGFTRRTDIETTYRFTDKLLEASSKFVLANPEQLRKTLTAPRSTDLPAVEVLSVGDSASTAGAAPDAPMRADDPKEAQRLAVAAALKRIGEECPSPHVDVLILGRYGFTAALDGVPPPDPRISIKVMTVHAAKGLEADYAIVLDVVGGKYGFPTEIVDDPLLELVLAGRMAVPNAEERRLFYVALTRARIKTFLLTRDRCRSVFIDELETPDYRGLVIPSGARTRTVDCPTCKGGLLVRREGQFGPFWSCSNYPSCKQKARVCPWCGVGALVVGGVAYRCANPECGETARTCPKCGIGAVVPKNGKHGPFWGCTEWRSAPPSCDYTSNRA